MEIATSLKRGMGWRPDQHLGPLPAAHPYLAARKLGAAPSFSGARGPDLRAYELPVQNQLTTESCTGQLAKGLCDISQAVAAGGDFSRVTPTSALYPYQLGKFQPDRPMVDEGAEIWRVLTTLTLTGNVPESVWPMDPANVNVKPPSDVILGGSFSRIRPDGWFRFAHDDRAALLQHIDLGLDQGHAVGFGSPLANAFMNQPAAGGPPIGAQGPDSDIVGYHAMVIVAHDRPTDLWCIRQSWGPDACNGDGGAAGPAGPGHFWATSAFLTDARCMDFSILQAFAVC